MCAVRVTLCVSGIVRAVHQSSSKLGDTPLVRLDLFESLPSRRFGCRASTTNSTAKSRSTSLYIGLTSSRAGCRALQLYSALHLYSSTALYTLHPLHPPSATRRTDGGEAESHTHPSSTDTLHVSARSMWPALSPRSYRLFNGGVRPRAAPSRSRRETSEPHAMRACAMAPLAPCLRQID